MRFTLLFPGLVLALTPFANGQEATSATAAAAPDSVAQKVSYVIGTRIGTGLKRDGIELDTVELLAGVIDGFEGKKKKMTEEQMAAVMGEFQKSMQERAAAEAAQAGVKNLKEGQDFLTGNGKKEGIVTTASGLQYQVLTAGDGPKPKLNDKISHKCFVHLDAIERRARRDVIQPEDHFEWYRVHDQVESYMLHQGRKFVSRFDANTYLRICEMWSQFDPVAEAGATDTAELFARSKKHGHRYLVFSIDEDYCFYPEEQAALVASLKEAGVSTIHITVHSERGHDSFLLEPELYAPHLAHTLGV